MANQENRVSSFQLNVYAFYGVFQNWGFWVPFLYGQMYMTNFLGIPIALTATILSVAKLIDFFFSLVAGGIVQSANLKKGKFLPWMRTLRFVIAAGAILQMAPIGGMPTAVKAVVVALGYCCMYCSMNFMATCQFGVMPLIAGSNMEDRIKRAKEQYSLVIDKPADYIKKIDKQRASYYKYFTEKTWSAATNYDISINTSQVGIDETVKILKNLALKKSE